MSKVAEPKTIKVISNPVVTQALAKTASVVREQMFVAEQRRAADLKRVAEIKQRF